MAEKTKVISEAKKQARERSIVFDLPRLLLKSPSGMLGLIIVLVVVFVAIFADFIIPCTPEEIDLLNMAQPPCWAEGGSMDHILGTDILGRDIFSRILVGSRVSLLVGIFSVVVAGLIGTVMGVLSGYFGGWIDSVVMRITDAFYSIPLTLFAMVMLTIMDPGVLTLVFVIGVTNWPFYARMVRGEVLGLKNKEYVKAARTIGTSGGMIMMRHILPNILPTFIVVSTLSVASSIQLVDGHVPRHCHFRDGAGHHAAGQLAARRAGPEEPGPALKGGGRIWNRLRQKPQTTSCWM